MVRYDVLGFNSLEEFKEYFLRTLLPTNKTFEYFVDWNKVRENVERFKFEIHLFDSLAREANYEKRCNLFRELLLKYPSAVKVIPMIIAIRERSLEVLDLVDGALKILQISFSVSKVQENIDQIVYFADKSGIIKLFDDVKNLYDYLIGVEVGLDTNARKNRSGDIFEKLVDSILASKIPTITPKPNITYKRQIPLSSFGLNIPKKVDFVIYANDVPRVIIETNFYNITGSKPEEIVKSYIHLQNELRRRGYNFIWVTDGPAWRKMRRSLDYAIRNIDFLLNFRLLKEKIDKIIKILLVAN